MTEGELIEYLNEHLSYELLMLRYAVQSMEREPHPLALNLCYDAAGMYARALYHFLTNDKDNRNVTARDFGGVEAKKEPSEIVGIFQRVDPQAMHLGKTRTKDPSKKFNLSRAKTAAAWIEKNFDAFLESLPTTIRDTWNPDAANPSKVITWTIPTSLPRQTSSSHSESWSSVIGGDKLRRS
jgi:hypothetical protein